MESREDLICLTSTRKEREMRKAESTSTPDRCSELYKAMDKKLKQPVKRFIYGFRKQMIEPVFGQIKYCRGLNRFLLKGLEKVKGEFSLWCISHNLCKIFNSRQKKAYV
jgi:hypothetical protein